KSIKRCNGGSMETTPNRTSTRPSGLMTLLRIAVLSLLTFFALVMGSIPANERNAIADVFAPTIVVLAPLLYFLPTIEAYLRQHRSLTSIGLVNLFLGWTLLGWVAAIAWACAGTSREAGSYAKAPSAPTVPTATSEPPASVLDELQKLAALKEQGAITDEEFKTLKEKVLAT